MHGGGIARRAGGALRDSHCRGYLIILTRSGAHDQVQGLRISIIRIVIGFIVMLAPAPVAAGAPRAPGAVWCA